MAPTAHRPAGEPAGFPIWILDCTPAWENVSRNYYASIPKELVEAVRMDGASMLKIYRHILLPISVPAFVVVLIWQFTSAWNNFLFAVVLTSPSSWPITVALNNMDGSQIITWNVQMAGSFLAAAPTLLVYIFLGC